MNDGGWTEQVRNIEAHVARATSRTTVRHRTMRRCSRHSATKRGWRSSDT